MVKFRLWSNMRINRFLSDAGVCSRREADRLISAGRVTIDGIPAKLGDQADEKQKICVDGRTIAGRKQDILLAFHKPRGIVCTSDHRERKNVIDYINYPSRIYPVGRLDKDSEGLLLLTNQGEIVNKIIRGSNAHEREYLVKVNHTIEPVFLEQMRRGIPILDTVTRPCTVTQTGPRTFRIVLTQGLNRQIRRMCAYCGYDVVRLRRIRIMNIRLGDLPSGAWREITVEERSKLYDLIRDSSNNSEWQQGDTHANKT